MERIQKLIAQAGIASRRKAEELIEQGRVKVNGKTASLGMKADGRSIIEVDGRKITNQQKEYYLLNKPKHCICSLHDEKGRDTVMKYMTGVNARVYPVGRLDYDTTGVLILSNDGEFSNLMMHPSHSAATVWHRGRVFPAYPARWRLSGRCACLESRARCLHGRPSPRRWPSIAV